MQIVVFGAGGCVGGWICEELSLRDDIEQVPCVRNWSSAVRLARRGLNIRRADLADANELSAILYTADVVVNAAMLPSSDEAELVTTLYQTCAKVGVRRFIQFSSTAIYGNSCGEVDERIAPAPIDDYGRGKARMERRLVEAAAGSSTQLVILRPSIIYGPFSEAWTIRYVKRVTKGRWRSLGWAGDGICNLVHAQDVARAAIAAATADIAPGSHLLNINGPDVVRWNEYIERLGDVLGTPDRVTPNVALFCGIATAAGILRVGGGFRWVRSLYRRSAGTTRSAMMTAQAVTKLYPSSDELNLLRRKVHYLANRAARILGVTPSISLAEDFANL